MIGRTIGSYQVVAKLGEGGMGEVYRATDTKLKRQVALKILPPAFSADPDRLARFQREAELLASLNHPHIAAIYGLEDSQGVSALVMELVEGEDLSQRIARGALPVSEALLVATQIADALETAHERGIIHRDLKPANIKVRPDDSVKVLDFGLAKAMDADRLRAAGEERADPTTSPTITSPAHLRQGYGGQVTEMGVILGTAAYMSPEQARGKAVDARTDLWAFGCVLFEMLTGTRAFPGDDVTESLAAVVKSEPDWTRLPVDTPPAIQTLLRRCLRKDQKQRLGDAGAVRIEIEDAIAAPLSKPSPHDPPPRRFPWLIALASGVAIALVSAFIGAHMGASRSIGMRPVEARLSVPLADGAELTIGASVAISPDGNTIAYTATRGGVPELYIRPLAGVEARVVSDTANASAPFFSPDSQSVGFLANGVLKKVSTRGGVVVTLADTSAGAGSAAWGANDTIAFMTRDGLVTMPGNGGDKQVVPQSAGRRTWLRQFLPGGDRLLVVESQADASSAADASIVAVTIKTGERKTLIQGSAYARYVPSGHLLFLRDGALWAVHWDVAKADIVGTPIKVLSGIRTQRYTGEIGFDCAATGTCVYIAGGAASARTVAMVDRTGVAQTLPLAPKSYNHPRFSPMGDRIVFWVEQFNCELQIFDVARGTLVRFSGEGDYHSPNWTPDGRRLTYAKRPQQGGGYEVYSRAADGSGPEERLTTKPLSLGPSVPHSWSRDGTLAFRYRESIWILPPGGKAEPHVFDDTRVAELAPAFSPDGRWLAYVSDESGRYDVYVRPFPGPGEKYAISTAGGTEPVWSRDGRALFFRNGEEMWSSRISATPAFNASRPAPLFRGSFVRAGQSANYDIAPDGQHFVMVNSGEGDRAATEISVMLNWFDELKRLVPAN